MTPNIKVQFVTFETVLEAEEFMRRWKEYKRSPKSDTDVTIQKTRHKRAFRYIAQHRLKDDQIQFVFSRGRNVTGEPQKSIKLNLAGGYTLLQAEKTSGAGQGESKVIAFITDPQSDLMIFKELAEGGKLNIYEPYYLNCKFEYVLEYFVKSSKADILVEQLINLDVVDAAVYKEIKTVKNVNETKKKEELHVWPSY